MLSSFLLGFGATYDTWKGEIDIDDLLTLSERRAVFATVSGPPDVEVGRCYQVLVQFTDLDGGLLPPPDISPITLRSDAGVELFSDPACSDAWANDGMTVIASCDTPASSSAFSARASSLFVIPPLNRETTIPTERRLPSGVPSSTV